VSEPTTVKELLEIGERVLQDSTHRFEDHDDRDEAEQLLAHVLGVDDGELDDEHEPDRRLRDRFLALIARRAAGEPFPILTGRIEFYGLDLRVRPGAFVPRPSSELIVERALRKLRNRRSPVVADICTGAGPIALALANEVRGADVWGTDISAEGLEQARANARRLGLANVHFRRGDMYGALPNRLAGRFDLIAGHIPYIPPEELDDLPSEVREHEPVFTLTDLSDDGLGLMRQAVFTAPHWLKPGGWLLLEMSEDLAFKVKRMCRKAGLETIGVGSDEDRLSIVVEARMPQVNRGRGPAAR
jgi:release factor glutamine methyltransferase